MNAHKQWLWISAVALFATPVQAEEPNPMLVKVGQGYFREYCASCHGLGGQGDGPAAAALTPPPADLTNITVRRGGSFPDGEIAKYIDGRFELPAHGSRAMPIWGRDFMPSGIDPGVAEEMARGRILTLVEYLKAIQRPSAE